MKQSQLAMKASWRQYERAEKLHENELANSCVFLVNRNLWIFMYTILTMYSLIIQLIAIKGGNLTEKLPQNNVNLPEIQKLKLTCRYMCLLDA